MKRCLMKVSLGKAVQPRTRRILEWGCACGFLLTIVLTAAVVHYNAVCTRVCGDTLRLHILANSDTWEDQLLKLQVRDAILSQVAQLTQNAENKQQAVQKLDAAMPVLQMTAQRALRHAGCTQPVQCRLEEMPFAARRYSDFWLPSGTYTALRVEIGRAEGHNWFCVLYPALCVGTSEARYENAEENALVFGEYQVRFALLDSARSVWRSLTAAE